MNTKIIAAFILVLVIVSAGSFAIGRFTVPAPPAVTPALSGIIPIGVIHSDPTEAGYHDPGETMALQDVNAWLNQTGKPVQFTLYVEQAEGSATKFVEKVQSLVGRGVGIIIGGEWSSQIVAAYATIQKDQVVLLSPSSMAQTLSNRTDSYVFRMVPDASKSVPAHKKVWQDLGVTNVIIVYANEAFGLSLYQQDQIAYTQAGINVYYLLGVDPDAKDYTAVFSSVEAQYKQAVATYGASKVGIEFASTAPVAATLMASLAKYTDLTNSTVMVNDSFNDELIKTAGETAVKVKTYAFGLSPPNSPNTIAFIKRHIAKYGYEPYSMAYPAYDAVWIAALSILLAGATDGPSIKAVLPQVAANYYGVSGWCVMNQNGDRAFVTFAVAMVLNENNTVVWKNVGIYDGVSDTIKWNT